MNCLSDKEFLSDLREASRELLSEKAFNRVILHYVYGYSQTEIARVEGKSRECICRSIGTSKSILNRIIKNTLNEIGERSLDESKNSDW